MRVSIILPLLLFALSSTGSPQTASKAASMEENDNPSNREQLRGYLRSKGFRILSWTCAVLLGFALVLPRYRAWLLSAAGVLSLVMALSVARISGFRNHKYDFRRPRDRQFLIFVAIYVGVIVLAAFLWAKFGR